MMKKIALIYQANTTNQEEEWCVEFEVGEDGICDKSIFLGLTSKEDAVQWAKIKYGDYEIINTLSLNPFA